MVGVMKWQEEDVVPTVRQATSNRAGAQSTHHVV